MVDFIVTYLVYILALVAVVFIIEFFHLKLELFRSRRKIFTELLEHGFDFTIDDIKEFIK